MAIRKGEPVTGHIKGITQVDRRTKQLMRNIEPGMIAVIHHMDMDELAAEGLIRANVKLIVNAGPIMSGTVPVRGPLLLLDKGIAIVQIEPMWLPYIPNRSELLLTEAGIVIENHVLPCERFTKEQWFLYYHKALSCMQEQLSIFMDNTLTFAALEKERILKPLRCNAMKTKLEGRPVLIVIRGDHYIGDLKALHSYIHKHHPVLIGVDGGADALLDQGYMPDLIVGDMDSVSDSALHCGAELVVQAYSDGTAPGMGRLLALGLHAITLPACGTSEDMALLLAYDHDCESIIAVGTHSHMFDFMKKGRLGMGSSMLVRIKVGSKLTDAKGFHCLIPVEKERIWQRLYRRLLGWVK
ncbi:Uncharacterized membrane-anchored protein [Paenibacillus sp. 1_12]|uniref:putative cytokinetic ring protein SteA n=1 Tax=Paenibacillus sp. 1_12 TaxID=1566278 RepID=UPI0008E2943B|nr:putative cytokinetic ring protein SteA [Paenibacillus sp. 1_12]SFK93398.1 Uncharacterized membrane-anchored protein [Paenibacillus sp. 1_12]